MPKNHKKRCWKTMKKPKAKVEAEKSFMQRVLGVGNFGDGFERVNGVCFL